MASSQTLKLLDALLPGSSGGESEKLKALYKEAYCSTGSFQDLKLLLERSEFHGLTGRELLIKSEEVIQAGFSNAGSFGDNLTVMEYLVEKIRQELETSRTYITSAKVTGDALNVIDKRLADQATEYYEAMFRYVCSFYASLYGASVLKNLSVKTGIRSVDLVRNIDDELVLLLAEARRMNKPKAWRIVRRTFGGLNLLHYGGFVLEYGSVTKEILREEYQKVSPTLFVPKRTSDVVCCGIGCLTSLDPVSGATVFGTQVTTEPALNCLDGLDLDYRDLNIPLLLQKIGGSNVCIVQPEMLVEILNRYFMIQTAQKNQQTGCPLCGKNGCRHFTINQAFSLDARPLQV